VVKTVRSASSLSRPSLIAVLIISSISKKKYAGPEPLTAVTASKSFHPEQMLHIQRQGKYVPLR
jgi:hypothetical protein